MSQHMLINAEELWDYALVDAEDQYFIVFYPANEIMVSMLERGPELIDKLTFAFEKMVREGQNTIESGDIEGMVRWFEKTYQFQITKIEAGLVFVLIQYLAMAYNDLSLYGIKLDEVGMFIISEHFSEFEGI